MKSKNKNIIQFNCLYRSVWQISLMLLLLTGGCKKFVTVEDVPDNILSVKVFNTIQSANAAINGLYETMRNKVYAPGTLSLTVQAGLYSDEIYNSSSSPYYDQFKDNSLLPNATDWAGYYSTIYACNAAIEGLNNNNSIDKRTIDQFIGEAKFIRSLCYYYLINLYGNVPLIISSDIQFSSTAGRAKVEDIYKQIILDLKDAENSVSIDYSISFGDRTRANKASIQALLSRIYLYQNNYEMAESVSNSLIESGLYGLVDINAPLYAKNSSEAIFQFDNTNDDVNQDAREFLITNPPTFLLTQSLSNSFEANDQRKVKWFKPYENNGQLYYVPNKFTTLTPGQSELYTPLRLGEQYLIRAESRIQQGKIKDGIDDLNTLRMRASLPAPNNLSLLAEDQTKENALLAVEHERRIELSCDMGHRFFDLKRTGRINTVMVLEKPDKWKNTSALFPIPLSDIQRNRNLTQNPGYE